MEKEQRETGHFIVLPNGNKYNIVTNGVNDLPRLMEFVAKSDVISLDVVFPPVGVVGPSKQGKLVLWGDTLKNSHIQIYEA